jgi:hypothetical protein
MAPMDTRDRRPVLAAIGGLLLLIGVGCALLGPVEIYCFYLFSEGGRFHYEGFGFGSFMFGNIASQIVGYYLIAAVAIPLGYGHLRLRRWARTLALVLLWFWLVVGGPLTLVFLFVLFASKDLSPAVGLIIALGLGLSYPLVPALLIRFYRGRHVQAAFARDPGSYRIEQMPMPILVLVVLFAFHAIVLNLLVLFNGIFPIFGRWLSGLPGIVALDLAVASLVCLLWGTLQQRIWAWWGSLVGFGLLTFSTVFTLWRSSFQELLSVLNFPQAEMDILQGLPFEGAHFALLVGIPLTITWAAIALSKRHFGKGHPKARGA